MSKRHNKRTAEDFGLQSQSEDMAIDPSDNSSWKKLSLYDYGWGKENGYARIPMLDFDQLLQLLLHSRDEEDTLGAAAVILDHYPEDLLARCELLMNSTEQAEAFLTLAKICHLDTPVNRCSTADKPYEDVLAEHERWRKVAEKYKEMPGK